MIGPKTTQRIEALEGVTIKEVFRVTGDPERDGTREDPMATKVVVGMSLRLSNGLELSLDDNREDGQRWYIIDPKAKTVGPSYWE